MAEKTKEKEKWRREQERVTADEEMVMQDAEVRECAPPSSRLPEAAQVWQAELMPLLRQRKELS